MPTQGPPDPQTRVRHDPQCVEGLGTCYCHHCPSASISKHHELLFTCKGTWTRMLAFTGTDDRCSFPVLAALGLILFQDLETLDLLFLALPPPSPPLPAGPHLDNSKSSSKTGSDMPPLGSLLSFPLASFTFISWENDHSWFKENPILTKYMEWVHFMGKDWAWHGTIESP